MCFKDREHIVFGRKDTEKKVIRTHRSVLIHTMTLVHQLLCICKLVTPKPICQMEFSIFDFYHTFSKIAL